MVHDTIACPSLMCFFDRGNTAGTNSSKKKICVYLFVVCFMSVCVGNGFVFCLFFVVENLWFDDSFAEQIGDRLKFVLGLM